MKKVIILLSAAICILASCQQEVKPDQEEQLAQEAQKTAPKKAIVKFSDEMLEQFGTSSEIVNVMTKSSELNEFAETYGIVSITRVFTPNERFAERHRKAGLHQWYFVEYDSSKLPETKAVETIVTMPGVEYAEPVRKIKSYGFNDPGFENQWHLANANGIDINVEGVWHGYTTGSQKVIVSVVDEGIDLQHPDLSPNTIPGGAGKSRNFVSNNYNITADFHGTHVAGIIGAASNNEIGVAGIAGGDAANGKAGVKMMSCQIFEEIDGKTVSGNMADAIVWGADNGAVISQNSWGYNYDYNSDGKIDAEELQRAKNDNISGAEKAAVDYFIDYAGCDENGNQLPDSPMKGGIVIFAAGNDAIEYGWPAQYEPILAVGSIASDGTRSSFSNFGEWVDICAPGSSIYSTAPGGGYDYASGTSMACPCVSGVAALILSHRGGLGFTNEMLWECLTKGASTSKITAKRIGPLVDAIGAMTYGADVEKPQPVQAIELEVNSNTVTLGWNVTGTSDSKPAYGASIYLSESKASIENLDPVKPAADVKYYNIETYNLELDSKVSKSISGLKFNTEYYVTVVPFNYGPIYAEGSKAFSFTTGSNNAPEIKADIDTDNIVLKATETLNINFTIVDKDNHKFTVTYQNTASESWNQMNENTYLLRISAVNAKAGTYSTKLTVEDEYKAKTEFVLNYEVLPNQAPVSVKDLDNILLNINDKGGKNVNLNDYFSEPDGDALSYRIENSATNITHVTVSNGILYATPLAVGKAEVTVNAEDPRGEKASQTIKIYVQEGQGGVDIYPTQVKDILYVGAGEKDSSMNVEIVSSTGASVFSQTVTGNIFTPAQIEMGKIAPGVYVVKVQYRGSEYKQNIVKL